MSMPPGMMMMRTAIKTGLGALALWASLSSAAAADCTRTEFHGASFTSCTAQAQDDIRMFLYSGPERVFGNFATVDDALSRDGKKLAFAMNGGMYHSDRRPVGLYIENGAELARLVTSAGPGNFGLLPNGVFCIEDARFTVIETRAFAQAPLPCRHATQSGPMLVIDGQYHPRFLEDSDSRLIRNGVGVSPDGARAAFVISNTPVNLFEFARFFRDHLDMPQALYIDGNVSRLHAPELRRSDWGAMLGPIVGKVVDAGRPAQ